MLNFPLDIYPKPCYKGAMKTTQLILAAIALVPAITFTFAYIARTAIFLVRGYRNQAEQIPVGQALVPAIFWTLFYVITHLP